MRVPRKSGEVIGRYIIAKIVEQQERIKILGIAEAEGAPQMDARAFNRRFRLDDVFDGTE